MKYWFLLADANDPNTVYKILSPRSVMQSTLRQIPIGPVNIALPLPSLFCSLHLLGGSCPQTTCLNYHGFKTCLRVKEVNLPYPCSSCSNLSWASENQDPFPKLDSVCARTAQQRRWPWASLTAFTLYPCEHVFKISGNVSATSTIRREKKIVV